MVMGGEMNGDAD